MIVTNHNVTFTFLTELCRIFGKQILIRISPRSFWRGYFKHTAYELLGLLRQLFNM